MMPDNQIRNIKYRAMQFCHYTAAKNGVLTRPEISIKTTNFQESGAADHEIYRRPVVKIGSPILM